MTRDIRRTARTITPAETEAEAQITPQVEREADVDAERFGGPLFRAMLDATQEEETPATDA